ncbi:MAG: hypothetical protein IPM85_09650 [Chitinophagaceae bacterium]|nr:hypothetical protein [Chitinophagaceae bacterium]
MRKLFFFLLGVHLLPSQPAAQLDKKYFDGLYNSLAYGRTESVFASLKEAYASAGVHFPDAMILKLQPFNEPLSYYNHDERSIKLSEMMNMPEQGSLYWRNWSNVLTDNKWKPNQHFKDEAEMMLAGNFAILGILAHEMGHAADYQYEIGRFRANDNEDLNNAIKELVADELAVMIMKKLAIDIRFKKLLDQYRDKIITSLRKSAPADRL